MSIRAMPALRPASSSRAPSPGWVATWIGAASLGVFILIQFGLETTRFAAQVSSFAHEFGQAAAQSLDSPTGPNLVASATNFLAVSIGAAALVSWHRRWFFAPGALIVLLPWIANRLELASPYPLGQGWLQATGPWSAGRFWLGASVDLTLALAPSLVLLVTGCARPERKASLQAVPLEFKMSALVLCLYVVGLYAWTRTVLGGATWWLDSEGVWVVVVPVCLFGALLGLGDLRRSNTIVAVSILTWWQFTLHANDGHLHSLPTLTQVVQTLPLVALVGLFAAWQPAARGLERLSQSTVALILTLNILNVADALLTGAGLSTGETAELNPVIRFIGLPAKIIVVAIGSLILARLRPRALIWPVLVFAAVLGWHIAGSMV